MTMWFEVVATGPPQCSKIWTISVYAVIACFVAPFVRIFSLQFSNRILLQHVKVH